MLKDHSQPFPPDPNAPPPPPGCATSTPGRALDTPAEAAQNADALDRELAQMRLIGPAAGAELRRIVNAGGDHDNAHRRHQTGSPAAGAPPTRSDALHAAPRRAAIARSHERPPSSRREPNRRP